MYLIYETDAFILESSGRREADKVFTFYTEDFGLIRARAQAVRKMESKLRAHLIDFSLVRVSLVRGKESWRIVAARRIFFAPLHLIQPLLLIKRFVHGELSQPKLFSVLREAYKGNIPETETVVRILCELGYIDRKTLSLDPNSKEVVVLINKAIRESQL